MAKVPVDPVQDEPKPPVEPARRGQLDQASCRNCTIRARNPLASAL